MGLHALHILQRKEPGCPGCAPQVDSMQNMHRWEWVGGAAHVMRAAGLPTLQGGAYAIHVGSGEEG